MPMEKGKKTPREGVFLSLGSMALQRNRLGGSGVAYQMPAGFGPGSDFPTQANPQVLGNNDINPIYNWGFRGALGYFFADQSVELVGWKVWGGNSSKADASQGSLYLPFAAYPQPLGIYGSSPLSGGNNDNVLAPS